MSPRASVRNIRMRQGAQQSGFSVLRVRWGGRVENLGAFTVSKGSASLLIHFEQGIQSANSRALVTALPIDASRRQPLHSGLALRSSKHFDVDALRRFGFLDDLKNDEIEDLDLKFQDEKKDKNLKFQECRRGGNCMDEQRAVPKDNGEY